MRLRGRTAVALIATAVVVAFVVGVIWRIHSSRHPVDTATVYAGDLAAVAIGVTLLLALGAWWRKGHRGTGSKVSTPTQVAGAANRLGEVMADRWRLEATRRRIVTPAPATVRWRWAAEEVTAPRPEVTTPPAPGAGPPPLPDLGAPGELLESGVVTRLYDEVYARLPHGRLVMLGGPGAGKTGAMILLLLAALDRRVSLTRDQRDRVPVPVWLTLGGWDPATTSLRDWAVTTMNRDHPALRAPDYGPDAANELLRTGRVALFLDGLDEMPDGVRAQALKRVDEEARGLRVVITSRPEEYRQALQAGIPANTAVIELRPVRPDAAAAYLLHGQAGPNRQRWEQVGAYLMSNPDSAAARALDNPGEQSSPGTPGLPGTVRVHSTRVPAGSSRRARASAEFSATAARTATPAVIQITTRNSFRLFGSGMVAGACVAGRAGTGRSSRHGHPDGGQQCHDDEGSDRGHRPP